MLRDKLNDLAGKNVKLPAHLESLYDSLTDGKGKPTRVTLMSANFTWENSNHTNSAIPIRPNDTGWMPEQRSCAAYSIKDIKDTVDAGRLKMEARFYKSKPDGFIQVRTVNIPPSPLDVVSGKIFNLFPGQNALGTVKPSMVVFDETQFSIYRGRFTNVPLMLENVHFPELGVGVYDINWLWEFRMKDESKSTEDEVVWEKLWRPMNVTRHRIFVLLEAPRFPWTPFSLPNYGSGAPYASPAWEDALLWACQWAQGAKTTAEAAKKIADSVFNSGRFYYNCNSAYFQEVTWSSGSLWGDASGEKNVVSNFFFEKLVERLQSGFGLGKNVNCLDCALIVSTLANLVGCHLRIGKLQASDITDTANPDFSSANRFEINPIRAIGHTNSAESMAGLDDNGRHFFTFHAIAWQNHDPDDHSAEGQFDHPETVIYDACLEFVAGTDAAGNEQYIPATGIRLGTDASADGYRVLLAKNTPDGLPNCNAQPVTVKQVQLR